MNKLRLTARHHDQLMRHLHPGDGREALAFILCGHQLAPSGSVLTSHRVFPVPYELCRVRQADALEWSTEASFPVLEQARRDKLSVIKIHSHPSGYRQFSASDDRSDCEFFPAAYSWMDEECPHASAILLPSGEIVARVVTPETRFSPVGLTMIVGNNIQFWPVAMTTASSFGVRTDQAFGQGTTSLMRKLTIGVVGCSGTGSLVLEQLARLGVGHLVLVDPDEVGEENLNRIIGATRADAKQHRAKVDVLHDHVRGIGLGTTVTAIKAPAQSAEAVRALANSDVLFGCVDTSFGRYVLNRLAAYYNLPYFDLGVGLNADGSGGIDHIAGAVHYLKPGGSSLLSRKAINYEQLKAEALYEVDPEAYAEHLSKGYIEGVVEARPAVISVNMHYASLAILEFLSRTHDVRVSGNAAYAMYRFTYTHDFREHEPDGEPCKELSNKVGLGDRIPLLDMPSLSQPQLVRSE